MCWAVFVIKPDGRVVNNLHDYLSARFIRVQSAEAHDSHFTFLTLIWIVPCSFISVKARKGKQARITHREK